MKHTFTLLLLLAVSQLPAADSDGSAYYRNTLDQLYNWQVSQNSVYLVDSLAFTKDAASFTLKKGVIFLLPQINRRTIAAVFMGEGLFKMTPPTQIEQDHLYRFLETKSCIEEFSRLFITFADTSMIRLIKALPAGSAEIQDERSANRFLHNITRQYLGNDNEYYFHSEILRFLLNEHYNSFFLAHMASGLTDAGYRFKISPYNNEEVTLVNEDDDLLTMFHIAGEYRVGLPPSYADKDEIKILHQNLNCSIETDMDFTASAECKMKLVEALNWVRLQLYYKSEIDSAFWSDGSKAEYFKGDENSNVWLKIPEKYKAGDIALVTIYYRSDNLLEIYDDWVAVRSYHSWRPSYGGRDQYSTFDLHFKTPEHFDFICVGDKKQYEEDDDYIYSHWVVDTPVRNITFNLGRFKVHEMEHPQLKNPISVLISESGHRGPEAAFVFGSGADMEKQVGNDVLGSMLLYQQLLGPVEMPHFYVTEYPRFWSGEAFPGLINLGWKTFQVTDSYGYDRVLRAHEVAHQWWGIRVDFESYHDQWLSEGLSEFCGMWYLHLSSEDKSVYMDMIEKSRELILSNRKYLFGDGQEAGPIWLGYRTNSSQTRGDYGLIIYQKSAWVIQMLRVMMLDLKTMNEDLFNSMMKDVFQSYSGKKITTGAFIKIVEKHFGMKMDWFFDQWIYNIEIPKYSYSYSTQKTADGKFTTLLKVKQENVPAGFQMYVPLKIDFGEDRIARLRVHVNKPLDIIKLPALPLEPEEIIFNDLNGVLAETEEVDWEDM